jgi:hypothetical protein
MPQSGYSTSIASTAAASFVAHITKPATIDKVEAALRTAYRTTAQPKL